MRMNDNIFFMTNDDFKSLSGAPEPLDASEERSGENGERCNDESVEEAEEGRCLEKRECVSVADMAEVEYGHHEELSGDISNHRILA